jgi:hypothetical protein
MKRSVHPAGDQKSSSFYAKKPVKCERADWEEMQLNAQQQRKALPCVLYSYSYSNLSIPNSGGPSQAVAQALSWRNSRRDSPLHREGGVQTLNCEGLGGDRCLSISFIAHPIVVLQKKGVTSSHLNQLGSRHDLILSCGKQAESIRLLDRPLRLSLKKHNAQ